MIFVDTTFWVALWLRRTFLRRRVGHPRPSDATSFILMQARTITRALAFDGDFQAAGLLELPRRSSDYGRHMR